MQDYIRPHKSKEAKKEKERLRHRDINTDDIDYIPASEQPENIFYDDSPKRVGAYIRVSTLTQTNLQHGRSAISI